MYIHAETPDAAAKIKDMNEVLKGSFKLTDSKYNLS
jgi:hypothetical protein